MSRDPRDLATSRPPVEPAPSEALSFARAILGESSRPRAAAAASDELDWEQLEFLASISPEHERKLRHLARAGQIDSRKREQLQWLAEISTEHKRGLDDVLREDAAAAEVRQRARQCLENLERLREVWDDSKHPRLGGPPNAGWFASTGGSSATALPKTTASKPDALVLPRGPQYLAQVGPPAQGGQGAAAQAPRPGQPQNAPPNPRPRNPFGVWTDRRPGYVPMDIRDNGVHPATLGRVTRAYNALPAPVKDRVLHIPNPPNTPNAPNRNIEVALDKDEREVRKNLEARGIEMDPSPAGVYDSRAGVIHVFDTLLPGSEGKPDTVRETAQVFRHEVGHAADHYLNHISTSPEFRRAYEADVADSRNPAVKVEPQPGDAHGLSSPQEAFAEAFGRSLGGHRREGRLRHSMEYMRRTKETSGLLGGK